MSCEVTVMLTFAVSAEKARQVLERWNEAKGKRKAYMRLLRAGKVGRRARAAGGSTGNAG
jgi:hypothetical protein